MMSGFVASVAARIRFAFGSCLSPTLEIYASSHPPQPFDPDGSGDSDDRCAKCGLTSELPDKGAFSRSDG
ncbi:hypothetical protein MPLA_870033 [Mesorhizobium sp. ORS 3359]|nr:hypothetical protein MPLA_870033 [Mesorhizobium sp. ORS 3359]